MPGVTARLPVDREAVRLTGSAGGGQILALDASVAALRRAPPFRPGGRAARRAHATARGRPPDGRGRPAPRRPSQVRLAVDLEIRTLERLEFDADLGIEVTKPAELSEIAGWRGLAVSVVVRDARGMLHRFGGDDALVDGRRHTLVVPLGIAREAGAASFAYPLDLLSVELFVSLPEGYQTPDATLTVARPRGGGATGAWQPVSLDLPGGWRSTAAFYGRPHQAVDDTIHGATLEAVAGEPGLRLLPGVDRFGRATILTFAPAAIGHVADAPIPVVASEPFLEASASQVGDDVSLLIDGVRREVAVTSAAARRSQHRPDDPIACHGPATLSLLRFEGNDAVEPPDEWWLAVDRGGAHAVADALAGPPFGSRAVLSQVTAAGPWRPIRSRSGSSARWPSGSWRRRCSRSSGSSSAPRSRPASGSPSSPSCGRSACRPASCRSGCRSRTPRWRRSAW